MGETVKYTVSAIKQEMIDIMWPLVEPLINRALAYSNDELTLESIYQKLIKDAMMLIVVSEGTHVVAALTLEKRRFDSGKIILNITTAGGVEVNEWMDEFLDICDMVAKGNNCQDIYIIGRDGWERKLKNKGFRKLHTVLVKGV